jgi:putative ABC transport system permease protein
VGIAFLIAAPVGYYCMHQWLSGFHYHTQLTPGIFVLAIVLSIAIAWLTVGYKAVKAALVNPVKSLKAE